MTSPSPAPFPPRRVVQQVLQEAVAQRRAEASTMTSSLRRPLSLSQLSSPPFGVSTRRASPTRSAGKATPLSGEGEEDGTSFFSVSTVSKSTGSPDMQEQGRGGTGRYKLMMGNGWLVASHGTHLVYTMN